MQLGAPKLQVVAVAAAGELVAENTDVPGVVTCTSLVTVLLPAGMEKPLPPDQFTVVVPVALRVPVSPLVKAVVHAASAQALIVSVLGVQVRPVPDG